MERLYYILTGQTLLSSFVSFKGKRKVISLPTLHIHYSPCYFSLAGFRAQFKIYFKVQSRKTNAMEL